MEAHERTVAPGDASQRKYKEFDAQTTKLEDEIKHCKAHIDLRTTQMNALKSRGSKGFSVGTKDRASNNQYLQESDGIFSGNGNYGVSTISAVSSNPSPTKKNRKSTEGPKVKTNKPYCELI